jgi:hypothetical protein
MISSMNAMVTPIAIRQLVATHGASTLVPVHRGTGLRHLRGHGDLGGHRSLRSHRGRDPGRLGHRGGT